jgi:hypothetical protein
MKSGTCIAQWEETVGYCANLRLTYCFFSWTCRIAIANSCGASDLSK